MNILYYITRYPGYGGIEKVTTVMANYFAASQGYSVSIVSVEQQDQEKLIIELNKQVKFFRLPVPSNLIDKTNIDFLNTVIKENDIHILIYQDSYSPTEHLLNCIDFKIKPKIIIVEHNTPDCYFSDYKNWFLNRNKTIIDLIKKILFPYFLPNIFLETRKRHVSLIGKADKYVLLSNKYIPILKKKLFISELNNVIAIENPITIDNITISKKEKICLFVGRLSTQKGVDKLLKIWALVEPKHPDWKLQIVGDGELKNEMQSYINEHNLKNVVFEGFQTNPLQFFQKASILCMTSIFEGWGLVLTEAMACGVVPIAFDSYASASEIIDDNVNGYLIKPFDIKGYYLKIDSLINNQMIFQSMSAAAIEKSKKFTINNVFEKWYNTFLELKNVIYKNQIINIIFLIAIYQ